MQAAHRFALQTMKEPKRYLKDGAALSYAVATTYAKSVQKVDPFYNAHGSYVGEQLY